MQTSENSMGKQTLHKIWSYMRANLIPLIYKVEKRIIMKMEGFSLISIAFQYFSSNIHVLAYSGD